MKTFAVGSRQDRFRDIRCPQCAAGRFRIRIEGKGFRFVTCRGCGLVYQNPQPLFADLAGRYRQDYLDYELKNEANFFHLMELGLRDIGFDRIETRFPETKRFLDVGCATGMLLESMRSRGWEVQGVDICPESAEFARSRRLVPVVAGTLHEASFPGSSFHVVHFSHLIEHVPDPKSFLAEVARILRPDGYLIVTTPNIDGLQARLFRERWRSAIADHLTLFSIRTLRRLLRHCGFQVLATQTWGGLAQGTAPRWLKRPADILAKRLGFGDVVLMLATRSPPP